MKFTRIPSYLALIALCMPVCSSVTAQSLAIDFTGDRGNRFAFGLTFGWRFAVDQEIDVTALGFFDDFGDGPGLQQDHEVGLWDSNGTLLAQATVTSASTPEPSTAENGQWLFSAIDPPLTLPPGEYVVGGYDPACSGSDCDFIRFFATSTTTGPVTFFEALDSADDSDVLTLPTESRPSRNDGYFGANFQFTYEAEAQAIPTLGLYSMLAAVALLVGTGGWLIRRRRVDAIG